MPWAIQKLRHCVISIHTQAKGEAPVRISPGCLAPGHKRNKCESHAVFRCKCLTKWKHQSQRDTITQTVAYKTLSQMWVVCKSVQERAREITEEMEGRKADSPREDAQDTGVGQGRFGMPSVEQLSLEMKNLVLRSFPQRPREHLRAGCVERMLSARRHTTLLQSSVFWFGWALHTDSQKLRLPAQHESSQNFHHRRGRDHRAPP